MTNHFNKLARKWAGVAGVRFAKADTNIRPGHNPSTGEAYREVPKDHITTQEAAELLQSGDSAARVKLKNHKIPFVMVSLNHASPRHYWKLKSVLALVDKTPPLASLEMIVDLLTMTDVYEMSGLARSTILRAVEKGELRMLKYRVPTEQGPQKRTFFTHEDVNAWLEKRDGSAWVRRFMDL